VDENNFQVQESLGSVFEHSLQEQQSFTPEDLPMEWDVGQHKYFRVLDVSPKFDESGKLTEQGSLHKKLQEFSELGVRVLDYGRRWGFWVIKTMVPQ
jgi:hypothetical protein